MAEPAPIPKSSEEAAAGTDGASQNWQPNEAAERAGSDDADAVASETTSASVVPASQEPTTSTAKGKEKEPTATTAVAAASSRPRPDSLSIDRTDAPGATSTGTGPASPIADSQQPGPTCNITLLLPTGARHPYKIDERYLTKRNVEIPDLTEDGRKDPFSISIYKLKELILREWRDEWDGKPASPSSIRLIHFGKLLDDKEQLKKYQLSAESPNVIHMSVRPAEMMEEEEGAKGKSSGSGGRSREGGGCCIIL